MSGSAAQPPLERSLAEWLRERRLFDSKLLVAYSAGPDSTALLAALASLRLPWLRAAYVEHGIRPAGERAAELALARQFCASIDVPLLVLRIRPGAVAELAIKKRCGIEAAARAFRMRALRGARQKLGARLILTAHTRDDQLETILMRFLGGSGPGGLKGIASRSGHLLRPLLSRDKAELLAYLELRGLCYSIDSSNASDDYLRNRIRHRLVPLLDELGPGWKRGLELVASKAAADEFALGSAARALFCEPGPSRGESAPALHASALLQAPQAIAARALVEASGRVLRDARFSSRHALSLLKTLRVGGRADGRGLFLRREGDRIILGRSLDFPRVGGYFVCIHEPCSLTIGSLEFGAAWLFPGHESDHAARGIRKGAFSFPLVVRSRRPGDSLTLSAGRKRIDRLLSEWKLPSDARDAVPIVEDRDGIVAVLGAAFGAPDRYRAGSAAAIGEPRLVLSVKGA